MLIKLSVGTSVHCSASNVIGMGNELVFFSSVAWIHPNDNILCDTKQCARAIHRQCIRCVKLHTEMHKNPNGNSHRHMRNVSHFVVKRHVKHFKYLLEMLILILLALLLPHSSSPLLKHHIFTLPSVLKRISFGHHFRHLTVSFVARFVSFHSCVYVLIL